MFSGNNQQQTGPQSGPSPRRSDRVRQMTFRVSVLRRADLIKYITSRDAAPRHKLEVPLDLTPGEFVQILKDNVPQCPESFDLCRVTGSRDIVPLIQTCPAEIRAANALNRSALYLRPKSTGQETSTHQRSRSPASQLPCPPHRSPAESTPPPGPPTQGLQPPGPSLSGPSLSGPSRSGPSRSDPSRSGPSPPGPSPPGPSLSGPSLSGPSRSGPSRSGPSRTGPSPSGPSRSGPSPSGPSRSGPSRSGQSPPGPSPPGPSPSMQLALRAPSVHLSFPRRFHLNSRPILAPSRSNSNNDQISVPDALRELQVALRPTSRDNFINVIRGEELQCALRAFKRPQFDPSAKMKIYFVDCNGTGEGAVDVGGPTREFCRLLMAQIQHCKIFEGPEECKALALDVVALSKNIYYQVGRMISVCLVQGGVSPHFFSSRLYCQISGMDCHKATVEEVVDVELRTKLEEIARTNTLDSVRAAVFGATDVLAPMGAVHYIRDMKERDDLVEAVVQFYCNGRIQAGLEAFKKGLMTLGILEKVVLHPQAFKSVFLQNTTSLTAGDLSVLFKHYLSPSGSNRRRLETRCLAHFRDWLVEVEGGQAHPIELRDILIFATGLDRIPAMGFHYSLDLLFMHPGSDFSQFPKANTCSMSLSLPVGFSYETFKSNMELGIGSSKQFREG